ncbi:MULTISPECIES: hypothetical protein [Peribacillus]|uniref:Peptide ABC transporter permease n=2 Tax=Peribacillus castrilensis TaxID=2897690 RepID=A0AAW9N771_9BACI|nr:hypothetical protein [Peribacillus frigoritolerans]MEC0272706.1 hypothetical protein [Peribacillus castrilensis]TFH60041.1 hypothetical protein E4J71_16700 [Peribacillus frigoritolerans]
MPHHLDRMAEDLVKAKMDNYWPGFELVAYAIYDKSNVYLFNHPKFSNPPCTYHILKWDTEFTADTIIMYEEYPTAIVNLDHYKEYEDLFSIAVHELFHGYQYIKDEKRFPDEMMGITYPLSKENVELRNQERANLYCAMLENNLINKKQYLNAFISLREKRTAKIEEYLTYENLIETIEGPAWYVELKAYSEKSPLDNDSVLKKYAQQLINKYESTSCIRRSCYSSGLFMCSLLEELSPGWMESFFDREDTLYDLLKQHTGDDMEDSMADVKISPETEEVINFAMEERMKAFEEFNEQAGIHLYIEGKITAESYDPMNIIPLEDKLLHKSFIKVRMNNEDFLIQQPVIAHADHGIQNINKLHLIVGNEPSETNDSLTIDGVGEIKGRYKKQENIWHVLI